MTVENKENLLGYDICTLKQEDIIKKAFEEISCSQNVHIVTINPEMMELAAKNEEFANILKNADIIIPDGIGIKIGFKIKGIEIDRIAGIELAYNILAKANDENLPVALIGAKSEILALACKNLKSKIQNLNIVYSRDGFFKEDEEDSIVENIALLEAKVVLVALGAPKQDLFIQKLKQACKGAIFVGVGGSFDVWSGVVKRAPIAFQKLGLEWLYRTIMQPSRFKRIFPTLPRFIFRVIMEERKNS